MEHHEERCLSTRNTPDLLALRGMGEKGFPVRPAGRDRQHPSWASVGLAIDPPRKTRDLLKRYDLARGLAGLALFAHRAQTGANPMLVKVRDSGGVVFQFLLRVAEKEQS
jgi:hypothetical protein